MESKTSFNDKIKRGRLPFLIAIIKNELAKNSDPIYNVGIHFVEGPTGVGKTLYLNHTARTLINKDGFVLSNRDQFYHKNIFAFDTSEVWNDGEMKFRLPYYIDDIGKCKGLIFDEINKTFNRRLNRYLSYNDIFIPLVDWAVGHRHDQIPRLYFIGQALELQDTQIQSIMYYKHKIRSKKHYWYYFWKEELLLVKAPKKLRIKHFIKDDETGDFVKFATTTVKLSIDDLITFNTHGFASDHAGLPVYNKLK